MCVYICVSLSQCVCEYIGVCIGRLCIITNHHCVILALPELTPLYQTIDKHNPNNLNNLNNPNKASSQSYLKKTIYFNKNNSNKKSKIKLDSKTFYYDSESHRHSNSTSNPSHEAASRPQEKTTGSTLAPVASLERGSTRARARANTDSNSTGSADAWAGCGFLGSNFLVVWSESG